MRSTKHKACFTDKYRKRMKKQKAGKIARKHQRARARQAEKDELIPRTLRRPSYPYFELGRFRLLRRLRDILVRRINLLNHEPEASLRDEFESIFGAPGFETDLPTESEIEEAEVTVAREEMNSAAGAETLLLPEGSALAVSPVCPLCSMVITPDHYRFTVETVRYNRKLVLVHKVCPNEPGYVWLREGSPGSGRFA